jgi:hypothetical protein
MRSIITYWQDLLRKKSGVAFTLDDKIGKCW